MYILLAMIAAGSFGAIIHVVTPDRDRRGVIFSGALAIALSAAIYAGLTWAGIAQTNIWLWVASIVAPVLITWITTVAITKSRVASDARAKVAAGLL